MALNTIYITGVEGLTYIEDSRLGENSKVMLVLREGKPLVETTGTPTGRQFKHSGGEYRIYVSEDIPIEMVGSTDPFGTSDIMKPEIFTIEYKSNV